MDSQIIMSELVQPVSFADQVKRIFSEVLADIENSGKNCSFNPINGGVSISFFDDNNMSFWVYSQKNAIKLEVKGIYDRLIDSVSERYCCQEKTPAGRFMEKFKQVDDIRDLRPLIHDVYAYRELEAKGRTFDCCHRYVECSDARDCIHPDRAFGMGCSYRRTLKSGTIFFGENRNID